MFLEIFKDVFKISGVSNAYFLKKHNLLIDAGSTEDKEIFKQIKKKLDFSKIKKVIFTHLHYDHIANINLFKNAKFYASEKEVKNLKEDPLGTVLEQQTLNNLKKIKIEVLTKEQLPEGISILDVPGHTTGSIALYDSKNKILFSGDTLFYNLAIGRTDLPTSSPKDMNKSLKKLLDLDTDLLCPGHDY
jgi:hydroxyacylglutathione hydrolase